MTPSSWNFPCGGVVQQLETRKGVTKITADGADRVDCRGLRRSKEGFHVEDIKDSADQTIRGSVDFEWHKARSFGNQAGDDIDALSNVG